ncbi:MAG: HAMP domain-containing histidine kinase, partial [bacterium]|nr:HAMP domain-containing histidine kinase [bacterium]
MLAAGAVHDMKNLMAIIIGYSNILKRDTDIGDKSYQLLKKIKRAAGTASQVFKQILVFSRQKFTASTTAVDMVQIMEEILELLKVTTPAEIKLVWERPPGKILFHINPVHLQQIVMNLCINGGQAMPSGGALEIALSGGEGKEIRLEVSDTGCGMAKEVRDKIFDPLFSTKEEGKGSGLGLFVVERMVADYDGHISVQSEEGKGTTFTVRFPV